MSAIGGFLRECWEVWESWGADPWVVEVLRFGYRIPFHVIPFLSRVPILLPVIPHRSILHWNGVECCGGRSAGEGSSRASSFLPGYYSRLFVTPKVTGGWRPLIDHSRLYRSVLVSHFHTETAQSVLQSLRPGDWMVSQLSLYLQDAYLQVPVHPSSRHYLRFCVGGSVLQFRALCFGLSTAPQVFTRVMAPISSIMHRYGFRILRNLDDWLVLGSTFRERVRAWDFLLWLCQELGVRVNLCKSSLTPQMLDYLGMSLHTHPLKVFPTRKRVQKLSSMLLEFVSCRQQPLLLWRQILGVMFSMSSIVPGSRLRMRSLQLRLNTAGRLLPDSASVAWDNSCLEDLQWCSDESHLLVSLPLDLPQPGLSLYTGASDSCWGAFLEDDHLSGLWFPVFSRFSINRRELLAVLYGVQGFFPVLRHQSVSLFMNNTTALSYLRNQGGAHFSTLNSVAQAILRLCEDSQIRLVPQFVPGHLNVLADSLSCCSQVLAFEWALCHQAFRELLRLWPATIDLFATSFSAGLPVSFSPVVDPQSAGTDTMMQPWDGLQAYAFSPFGLLHHVLSKVRQSRGLELTLVVSFWPQRPWFLELLVAVPVSLPLRRDLLRQPHFHRFHQNLHVLQLIAFRISSDLPAPSASLRRWLVACPLFKTLESIRKYVEQMNTISFKYILIFKLIYADHKFQLQVIHCKKKKKVNLSFRIKLYKW